MLKNASHLIQALHKAFKESSDAYGCRRIRKGKAAEKRRARTRSNYDAYSKPLSQASFKRMWYRLMATPLRNGA